MIPRRRGGDDGRRSAGSDVAVAGGLDGWALWLGAALVATAAHADLSGVPPVSATVAPAPPAGVAPAAASSAAPAAGLEAAQPDPSDATPAPRVNRYALRFRLDDGRYRGFHQDNPDDLRTPERVGAENDKIRAEHRAQGRDLYP